MKKFTLLILVMSLVAGLVSYKSEAQEMDRENILYIEFEFGRVGILMRPDKAPKHVARIKELVRQGFYNGTPFHRVIEGFMAQGGDPEGTGLGGSGQNLEPEFNDLPHLRGTVSMARADKEDSADSQFFICFNRVPALDNNYTVWGRVFEGMDYVDMINRGEPPRAPTKIVRMVLASDAVAEDVLE